MLIALMIEELRCVKERVLQETAYKTSHLQFICGGGFFVVISSSYSKMFWLQETLRKCNQLTKECLHQQRMLHKTEVHQTTQKTLLKMQERGVHLPL